MVGSGISIQPKIAQRTFGMKADAFAAWSSSTFQEVTPPCVIPCRSAANTRCRPDVRILANV